MLTFLNVKKVGKSEIVFAWPGNSNQKQHIVNNPEGGWEGEKR